MLNKQNCRVFLDLANKTHFRNHATSKPKSENAATFDYTHAPYARAHALVFQYKISTTAEQHCANETLKHIKYINM